MRQRSISRQCVSLAATLLLTLPAVAQIAPPATTTPAAPAEQQNPVPAPTGAASPETGLLERDSLLGTLGGVRTGLAAYGLKLGLSETSEVLGNATGGVRTGVVYEGLTTASLDLDLPRLNGLARVSALQIHGRGLSTNNIGNLQTVSSLEATRSTRLFELWYQQSFLEGKVDLRLGQQSADLEFDVSSYAGLFINSNYGWSTLFTVNLPSGGAAYPLATPAARLGVKADPLTFLLAVYNGSPSGNGSGDPQGVRNPSGTRFGVGDGVFVIAEAQYAADIAGRAGTYKLGGWYNDNAFTNQFFTTTSSTTAPLPGAIPPRNAQGDWSIYGVFDQLVWRKPDVTDGGVGVFARIMGSPGDRNLVNLFVDTGVTYKGVFGRENDTVGIGLSYARIGDTARAADRALSQANNDLIPTRSSELVLELTYQAQLIGSVQVQPVFQYIVRPGAGLFNPDRPAERIKDAAVFGLRSNITF